MRQTDRTSRTSRRKSGTVGDDPQIAPALNWFAERDWHPFEFQRQAWQAYQAGESGLIHATTGTGKTLAAWFGPLLEAVAAGEMQPAVPPAASRGKASSRRLRNAAPPLRVLWVTPLRALAADTEQALRQPLNGLGLNWSLESRTGDTSAAIRGRQKQQLPTALIITPESLELQLSYPDAKERFAHLRCVIVDEWHELLGTKRGTLLELSLARLRRWQPNLRLWGLSATLGNLQEALDTLVGRRADGQPAPRLLTALSEKQYEVDTLIPEPIERFPWAGHLGMRQVPAVVAALENVRSAIVFTNTRAQTELWYQAILKAKPGWAGTMALHHGSLSPETRRWVEAGLREGGLRCVVSTSSLDLGVDFSPVDRVFQVGSPKGVGRLLQRAGRSGHQPGEVSRVTCVPTNALELVEIAAARDALQARGIEARRPLMLPVDVLLQHVVTCAAGGGFVPEELFDEVRDAHAYANLSKAIWEWVLDFVSRGGTALRAYEEYQKVREQWLPIIKLQTGKTTVRRRRHCSPQNGRDESQFLHRFVIANERIARTHRMAIGTITADTPMEVRFLRGGRVGMIEESFVSRLKPGDRFLFAGRTLELVKIFEMKAWVRKSNGPVGPVPRWRGSRLPLSTELAAAVRRRFEAATAGRFEGAEMRAVRPILELQARWSHLPGNDELLIESIVTNDGQHLFFYPFSGRMVHEGFAALVAYRLSQLRPITFAISVNDYGFELHVPWDRRIAGRRPEFLHDLLQTALRSDLLSPQNLAEDIAASLNSVEMAKRQFREIARVAGLVFMGYPGSGKTTRQLQASTGLLFDVFRNYDPENLLLRQADLEVLERQLNATHLVETLEWCQQAAIRITRPQRPTPLAFPLLVDRLRERLSSEKLADRVRRLTEQLERAADRP